MTESNSYHHGALKETLLNSALDKLSAGQAVTEISIRALAAEAGVSKPAPRLISDCIGSLSNGHNGNPSSVMIKPA